MCYSLTTTKIHLEEEKFLAEYKSVFHNPAVMEKIWYVSGFAHPDLPVITMAKPNRVQYYQWGFIPPWARDMDTANDMAFKCLNAVSETIFDKPAFRACVNQRCLIITDGFYEWRHEGKKTYPYFIRVKDKDFFYFGGLYNSWTDRETGEIRNTVTILTTPANPMMEKIHNTKKRMPLIIDESMADTWLSQIPTETVKSLMQPYNEEKMESWTISRLISERHADKNVPEIQKPVIYPELQVSQASLF